MKKRLPPECFRWRGFVIKDKDLSFGAKAMALYLDTFTNDSNDLAYPSLRRIEYEMSLSRKTVLKYISELERGGWVSKGKVLNPKTTQFHNSYTVKIPGEKLCLEGGGACTPPALEVVEILQGGGGNQGSKVVEDFHPNNQRNNQGNKGRFHSPTKQEVRDYWQEKSLAGDPDAFFDYFENTGWRLSGGKGAKMKDFRLAANNWSRRDGGPKQKTTEDYYGKNAL